jgi:hypothetical protein
MFLNPTPHNVPHNVVRCIGLDGIGLLVKGRYSITVDNDDDDNDDDDDVRKKSEKKKIYI